MKRAIILLLIASILPGCATKVPEEALRLEESTLDIRSLQTRRMSAPTETDILAATIAVLQDMEFNIDRIEKPLGVISASKVSDADSGSEKAALIFLDVLCAVSSGGCNYSATASDEQHVLLTIVVLPSLEREAVFSVRVTLQRVVYDKQQRVKVQETIVDAETYQRIFDNLRQSLFIQVSES